jgi:hypothetical protein
MTIPTKAAKLVAVACVFVDCAFASVNATLKNKYSKF